MAIKNKVTTKNTVSETLANRGTRYGSFDEHARITQNLKAVMKDSPNWQAGSLSASQMESLEMIQHKIGRILNGDANYADSWHDIAGYAMLVESELEGE